MPMESRFNNRMRLLPLCLLLILMLSCGPKDQFIGTYKAEVKDSPKQAETVLELKADGDGIWIVGSIENAAIRITLPGSKTLSFKKIE